VTHPEGGGSERYVEQLAGQLAAAGDDVTIHCAAHGNAPRRQCRDGVRFVRAGGRMTVYIWGLLSVLRRRPDVVIDVQNGVPFFSVLVHRRVVLLVHHVSREQWSGTFGPLGARAGWWIESWLSPRLYRRCEYVAVSGPTRDDLVAHGVDADRISIVYNATEPVPVVANNGHAVGSSLCVVARLVPHKRVEDAVEVLARLAPDNPELRLRVVGEGPSRGAITERASRLGVLDRLDLLGWLDEAAKHEVMASSWLLLCPSGKEGWGRVVMEAAAHEVPAIAYRHAGGLSESIRHGQTGLLAGDLGELVEHTRWLLEHPAERAVMGKDAREYVSTFTAERTYAQFQAVLARLRAKGQR
jgi:glycosyltransferase involved in cell wall biosynthesis